MSDAIHLLPDSVANQIAAGEVTPIEQSAMEEGELKPAPKIFKEDGRIDWRHSAESIHNLVRGLSPYPAAWTPIFKDGAEIGSAKIFTTHFELDDSTATPGTIRTDSRSYLAVRTADGWIYVDEIQMAGKRRMPIKDALLGLRYTGVRFIAEEHPR